MAVRMPKLLKIMLIAPAIAAAPAWAQEAPIPAPAPVEKFGYYGDVTYGAEDGIPVVEYMSLTCGHCGHFQAMVLPGIKSELIETGKIKFTVKNFIRDQLDMAMAVVSRCRDEEFARKAFHKLLIDQARWLSGPTTGDERLAAIHAVFGELGMEQPEFEKCMNNQALAKHIYDQLVVDAEKYKIASTPTILVGETTVPVAKAEDLVTYLKANFADHFAD